MRVTTKSRYAVRALVNMARRPNSSPVPLSKVASEEDISLNFLEQIFMALKHDGIVSSVRGPSGGYLLQSRPEDVSVARIMRAVGESISPLECVDGGPKSTEKISCPREENCTARLVWSGLAESMTDFLGQLTIGDIVEKELERKE